MAKTPNTSATILATTSSFGLSGGDHEARLAKQGLSLVCNPHKRKINEAELLVLLKEHRPVGLLAGVEPITGQVLEQAKTYLQVISRVGVGWDAVDHEVAAKLGIPVFRTEHAVTPAVVELTIGLFLDMARRLSRHDRDIRAGQWQRHMGTLIRGKTLGVIGCGRIGKSVVLAMMGLGCHAIAYDPQADESWHQKNGVPLVDRVDELVARADLISLHTPLTETTKNIINAHQLEQAKPSLLLVNTARGGLIDENALYRALKEGKITGAALDVFSNEPYVGPLRELDNITLTAHIGSYAAESRLQMETDAVTHLLDALQEVGFGNN